MKYDIKEKAASVMVRESNMFYNIITINKIKNAL